ncbi:hypothetical protein [Flavobacterium anhuiense]|uniref:Lipoprotein n=1 Tax=Flavobacterium anhuiense TaxID=459526 RepID=A0ABY0L8T6_9FLAO|nr:hypothetical protein [Flavobacterium anhuiense]URM38067.1 hypothetical protein LLY39_05790 [Flavobacterium anhuiense]SCX89150.1 hypothetical protein SAMN02927916_0684 [Flavobacterium anhuiense]
MKKKYFLIAVITIILFGCNNSKKEDIKYEKVVEKEFHPFFDSDEIDHYYVNYTLKNVLDFIDKDRTSKRNKEFSDLFMGYYPNSIPKKDFVKTLLSYGYKKSKLTIRQQKEVENVFSAKDSLQMSAYACVAEYRDIFIFKKKKKTIGIAKICFKCGRFQIVGSKLETEGFGLWSDLKKLHNIVRPNEKKT